jgi:hypothetical protein
MVYVDNRIITLNSQDGDKQNGTYLSNINFYFSGLLKDDPNLVRAYVTILNCQIPVSFYIITSTNNVLSYTESFLTKTITIPIGNYNGNQMVTALNTGFTNNGSSVTASLNSQNGILNFIITDGNTYVFLSSSSIKKILGFSSNITSTTLITMPFQLNLLGKKKLFINSNHLRNNAFSSKSFSCVQTIATIPVDKPPYEMISYVSISDLEKNILFNRSIDTIDIQIVDENSEFVDFQNIDWSITICLSIEKNDIVKLDYGLLNLSVENKNNLENIKKLSRDEKDLKLLES